ncbi:MAG: UpxY family transcription antiterminator [Saprospiraceae bacterium]|nr:UpxY family transcription antiterminator [Saprospiraceae bacterium]
MISKLPKQEIIINQLSPTETRWFAVYTKYKCEKYVADQLSKKNIEAYVPIISKTRRYSRKIKHYQIPLINCYVFVCISKANYIPTLETEYVMKFLKQGKDLLCIPPLEIDTLKRVAGDVEEIYAIENNIFQAGEEVEVISGHLTGMRGKIISRSGKRNFVIELNTIGYQLSIQVDLNLLRPIKNKILIA